MPFLADVFCQPLSLAKRCPGAQPRPSRTRRGNNSYGQPPPSPSLLSSPLISALRSLSVSVQEEPRLPSWRERQLSDTDKEWNGGEGRGWGRRRRSEEERPRPAELVIPTPQGVQHQTLTERVSSTGTADITIVAGGDEPQIQAPGQWGQALRKTN